MVNYLPFNIYNLPFTTTTGGLAQLARALDLHSRGHRFDSDILHKFDTKLL